MKQSAFTLIELMLALSLTVLICCLAVPYFSHNNELELLRREASIIKTLIRYAKVQAVANHKTIYLQPISSEQRWDEGISVLIGKKINKNTFSSQLIYVWRRPKNKLSIQWKGFQSQKYLAFSSDIAHNATNGYFTIQSKRYRFYLILNKLGRVRTVIDMTL